MWTLGLIVGLAGAGICASVGEEFIVEDTDDGQNGTIISADDVALSPGLDKRDTSS